MNTEDVVVPATGNDGELEVIEISVSVNSDVDVDETIVVLESDKATVEVPSPKQGKVLGISVSVGDKVKEGAAILTLELSSAVDSSDKNEPPQKRNPEPEPAPTPTPVDNKENKYLSQKDNAVSIPVTQGTVHAGPSVRKFSREHGVDLGRVSPSGPKHRILVEDVSAYIKQQVQHAQHSVGSTDSSMLINKALPDFSQYGKTSTSSMSSVQYKTAENMQRSWSVPHVTQFDEADITDMEVFRKQQKTIAESRGLKLTPIAFILKACAYALQALPQFNVSLDLSQKQLIQKHFIHIGFAVDTPHGLFVPVIRDVDQKNIWQLAAECQDLANRAKEKKLTPSEMQGGCFTVSSLGALGGTCFTPIVNTPEVAILGVSKAQMKPIYVEGDKFEARLMLPLSLSYDHRAVNGADGARFTTLLTKVMGDLRELLL